MNNNIEDEDGYAVVIEQPIANIISKDNICYNQAEDTNYGQVDTVTRESGKDSKTKFIIVIVVIVLVLSAICVCTIYTLLELSKIKSEISSSNNMISSQKMNASLDLLHQQINDLFIFHQTSCAGIHLLNPSSPSGYYSIMSSNGSPVSVYCDMTLSCGNITGGWRKVAELDMTDNSNQCPSTLTQRIDFNKRTCAINSTSASCAPVIYSIDTIEYSKVCGKIKAYQVGSTDAFGNISRPNSRSIDSNYVDGISLTHGRPRKHIWTFAGSVDESGIAPRSTCPCTNINQASNATTPPAFVGNNYFCDTASQGRFQFIFYGDDPLWDGAGCGPLNTCCTFNNPPWFYKELPEPTTDDIEMRVCKDQASRDEDIAIEKIDIFVQ